MFKQLLIGFTALLLLSGCYTNDYSTITKEYNEKNVYRIGKNITLGKLNDLDRQGYTMLAWAVFWNNTETAKHLIEKGASVDAPLKIGNLWNLALNMRVVRKRTDVNEIGSVVEGFNIHYPKVEMVEILQKNGLNINLQDKEGNTPLHLAVSVATFSGDTAIIDYLFTQKNLDSALKNQKGESPLEYAQGSIEEVKKQPEKYGFVELETLKKNFKRIQEHMEETS